MDIRERIDILRQGRGWSRMELAREVGISYTAIKNWYNEKNQMPSLRVIDEICSTLDISKAQLFAEAEIDNLREVQIALLELYERMTDKQKRSVIAIIKSIII